MRLFNPSRQKLSGFGAFTERLNRTETETDKPAESSYDQNLNRTTTESGPKGPDTISISIPIPKLRFNFEFKDKLDSLITNIKKEVKLPQSTKKHISQTMSKRLDVYFSNYSNMGVNKNIKLPS
jgi:hypothetical protein